MSDYFWKAECDKLKADINTLRAELAAAREANEILIVDKDAAVKWAKALEIVVSSYGPWIEGTKPQIALTEIRKLTDKGE